MDEKIGQMLVIGVDGYELNDDTKQMIVENHIGGFILFGSNIESTKQLQQ